MPFHQTGRALNYRSSNSGGEDKNLGQTSTVISNLNITSSQITSQDDKKAHFRVQKVTRLSSSDASVSAAIVEAENDLEIEVHTFYSNFLYNFYAMSCKLCNGAHSLLADSGK